MSGLATVAALLLALVVSWAGHSSSVPPIRRLRLSLIFVAASTLASGISLAVVAITRFADVPAPLLGPIVGIGGIAAAVVMPLTARPRLSWARRATFALLVSILIAVPVAVALFASDGLLQIAFRTLDLAGALPALHVAALAGGIALWAQRREPREPPGAVGRRTWRTVTLVALVGWTLWIGWLVGMELAIDDVTARIVVGAIVTPVLSAATWLVVQRLRHDETTREGAIAGLVTGLAAITSACGYVDVVGAAVIGVAAGALGSIAAHSLVTPSAPLARLLPIALTIGSGTGIVALGIFSTRIGLAYTGQPELLFGQVASLLAVAAYAGIISLVLWRLLLRLRVRPASAS